jgi:thiosulfate dehydrogenase (quinone) large subunit
MKPRPFESMYWRTGARLTGLVILRVLIGWHFLHEGIVKLINPYWSSAGYLSEAQWIFAGLFKSILSSSAVLSVVDFLNIWGLILIGLGLITGLLTRPAAVAGMVLLALYYLANPPFIGYTYSAPSEGNYLFVNKNLIELAALCVLAVFPTGRVIGLDRLAAVYWTHRKREAGHE